MEKLLTYLLRLLFLIFSFTAVELDAQDNKTLKILLNASQISLNPTKTQDVSSLFISRQINCQLFRARSGEIFLEAASAIKYLNSKNILITINKNAKFTDNTPVESKDVIATFNYLKNSTNVFRNVFSWMKSIKKIDEKTFQIQLTHPVSNFLNVISSTNYAIYKEEFLKKIDTQSWKIPIGCGGYKITERSHRFILLEPVNKNHHSIKFYFNQKQYYTSQDLNQYDLIYWRFPIKKEKLSQFKMISLFDPIQMYIGLNVTKKPWNTKEYRCSFLSKIDRDSIIRQYNGDAIATNSLFPKGIIGYKRDTHFSKEAEHYLNQPLPKLDKLCLAFSRGAVPPNVQKYYENSIKPFYPSINTIQITNFQQAVSVFRNHHCDAIILGFKSNYFDGYEFLVPYSNSSINFSGLHNKHIDEQIESSQNIDNPMQRSVHYQHIEKELSKECITLPLLTIPMMHVYIKNSIDAPGIGRETINEYYLGNIK